ncbi:hypothetical protein D3C83_24810 [compost metagenome]
MQRRLLPGPRFGHDQRAVREVDRQQTHLAGDACARVLPAESPGDHQVEDQEQLTLELEHDALPQPVEIDDPAAHGRGQRRVDRAQQEG